MKKKNKIRLLYLLVFLTTLLLSATSYAWFTTTKMVSIETLNIHIASEGGIEISSDAVNWKAVLDLNDLYNASDNYIANINQIPTNMKPISTAGDIENGYLKMYRGEAVLDNDDVLLVAERSTETKGHGEDSTGEFIAFDIFLKTKSVKSIYLNSNSEIKNTGTKQLGIENSFRVAFLNEGYVTDESSYTVQNYRSATKAYIWEPNSDTHELTAINNAKALYNIDLGSVGSQTLNYYGVINEIKESDNVLIKRTYDNNYPNFLSRVNVDIATRKEFNTNQYLFDINPGITKLRIYIWIEGQDVDCEDGASLADLLINLQITTVQ